MSDSHISYNRLVFSSQIEIVSSIEECHLDEIVEYMLKHILLMQLCKSDDDDKILINLVNTVEFRSVISSVAQLVKLLK